MLFTDNTKVNIEEYSKLFSGEYSFVSHANSSLRRNYLKLFF